MATIEVKGTESTVKIIILDEDEGVMGLECDKGAWCNNFMSIANYRTTNWVDAINEADIHADRSH